MSMMLDLSLVLVLIIIYFGLIMGIYFATISVEELSPGKKWFIFLKKILLFLLISISLNYLLNFKFGILVSIIIAIPFVKISIPLNYSAALVPLFVFVDFKYGSATGLLSGLSLIYFLILSSAFCSDFVKKNNDRKLTEKKFDIIKKIIKGTNFYFISSLLFLILSLF